VGCDHGDERQHQLQNRAWYAQLPSWRTRAGLCSGNLLGSKRTESCSKYFHFPANFQDDFPRTFILGQLGHSLLQELTWCGRPCYGPPSIRRVSVVLLASRVFLRHIAGWHAAGGIQKRWKQIPSGHFTENHPF